MSIIAAVKGWFTHNREPSPAAPLKIEAALAPAPVAKPASIPPSPALDAKPSGPLPFKLPTLRQMQAMCPKANSNLLAVFLEQAAIVFPPAGIRTQRHVNFILATLLEESTHFTRLEESLSYTAKRLTEVWPGRFPTLKAATPYARSPARLAEKTYGGRMGNTKPGDGWAYRGRSVVQLTGRDAYRSVGKLINMPLEENPDMALDAFNQAAIVAGFFAWKRLEKTKTFQDFTRLWNGGLTNYGQRVANLKRIEAIL